MQSLDAVSPTKALAEALGLGCSAGLLHAIAETTLLGLNGIRPSALDLAIFVVTYCAASAVLAAFVALAAMMPPLRTVLGAAHGPLAFRRVVWTAIVGAYLLVFLRIVYFWSGWHTLLWLIAAAPPLAIAWLAVSRKGQRALVPLCGAALVATTLCALQLLRADWGHDPASPVVFAIRLLIPIGVSLAALLAVLKTTSPDRPFEPITRGAGALGLLVAAWAGYWVTLDSGVSLGRVLDDAPAAASAKRPNFLLIVLDTVRADHLDLFGYERQTMPNLRRFAEQSQVANRMFTTGSWTLASHGSMFTGLYPSAHRAHHLFVHDKAQNTVAYPLREDVPTLAEFFDSLGYQTAGIVSNFAALSGFGMGRGFEHYDTAPGGAFLATRILWLYRAGLGNWSPGVALQAWLPGVVQARSRLFSLKEPLYRRAWEINVRARQWLERRASRPFFLFLNYLDAHSPYLPLPEDDERFAKRPPGEEWFAFPVLRFLGSQRGAESFTAEEVEFLKAQYDAELVSLDRELGRLFDFLRESALLENTVVFITTDHGESFFEHGFPDHGNSLYQHEIGGFLVIKTPPSLSPVQVSPLMQFVDFLPTAAAILNEPVPAPVQGSAWGNGRDYALSEMFCKGCGREMLESTTWPDVLKDELIAVIRGNTKLIRSMRNPDTVYDLSTDPAESKPLADPDPEFVRRAEEIIAERNKRLVEGLSARPEDKILLEKLRSLGYVQ